MASLFDIGDKIRWLDEFLDKLEDEGRGPEEVDGLRERVINALNDKAAERDEKLNGYAWLIKKLDSEQLAAEQLYREFRDKRDSRKKRVDFLKGCILQFLDMVKQDKVSTAEWTFAAQKNGGLTPVDIVDESKIPNEFIVERVERVIMTEKLRAALEAGTEVPGAKLGERGKHLRIR